MKVNYHTHTNRCLHADGVEEDYVISAIESGIDILGFSDHAPFPDKDYGYRMSYNELDDYIDTINSLSKKYANTIQLKKGLEIEYLPEYMSYYEELLTKRGLEYLLLGEHMYHTSDGILNMFFGKDTLTYIDYAKQIEEALHTGYFKILAHPDLFAFNPHSWDKNCDTASDIIINAAQKSNTILEYNANGIRRGINNFPDGSRYPYPHKNFWNIVSTTSIPVVVGADCHSPSQVWDKSVDAAYSNLKEYGIKPITVL